MELYVYDTPYGRIADFRAYLDGHDHAFDDHRPLAPKDPRREKIDELRHPVQGAIIAGRIQYVGRAETKWRELMRFPIAWTGELELDPWDAPAASSTT
jgi:hypothetical protein